MKKDKTLDRLVKICNKDLGDCEITSYEELRQIIIRNILASNRSIQDQKTEIMLKFGKLKNYDLISGMSFIFAYLSISISMLDLPKFNIFEFILMIIASVLAAKAVNLYVRASFEIPYYELKLHCIKEIEKENFKKGKRIIVRAKNKDKNIHNLSKRP